MTRVSVCMATCNGADYIREQLDSILDQLEADDEVIICDDMSTDATCAIIQSYTDLRIKYFRNSKRLGHVQNFCNAITLASGEYIALSDQDDIWVKSRLLKMVQLLKTLPKYSLVIGGFSFIDEQGKSTGSTVLLGNSPSFMLLQLLNIFLGKAKYYGCNYLFSSDLREKILPIPKSIEAHDNWIAMNACLYGRIGHLDEDTLMHRLHNNNLTPKSRRALTKILKSRLIYIYYLVGRLLGL